MKQKLLPLFLLLLGAALIPVASAEIIRETRVHVGKKHSSHYSNSRSSCNSSYGYNAPVKRVIAGYCRAGRPIYKYVRVTPSGYHSNSRHYRPSSSYGNSSCRTSGSYIRIRL